MVMAGAGARQAVAAGEERGGWGFGGEETGDWERTPSRRQILKDPVEGLL